MWLRILCGETRTENASITPEVVRLQAREAPLSTRVSTMRSQETEFTNTVADSPTGECSEKGSYESNSNCKRIYGYSKSGYSQSELRRAGEAPLGLASWARPCGKQSQELPDHSQVTSRRITTFGISSQGGLCAKLSTETVVSRRSKKPMPEIKLIRDSQDKLQM